MPLDQVFECFNTPPDCSEFYFGWAPGLDFSASPREAGFPIGGQDDPCYMLLQVRGGLSAHTDRMVTCLLI